MSFSLESKKKDESSYKKQKDAKNSHLSLQLKQPLSHQMEHADVDGNGTEKRRLWEANCERACSADMWYVVQCGVFTQLGVGCGEVAVLSCHVLRGFRHASWFADLDTNLSKEV